MPASTFDGPTTPELVKWIGGDIQAFTQQEAERVLKEEVGSGLFTTEPLVVTDGVPGRDYRSVKAYGRIEFIARPVMRDAVQWTLDMLRRMSPELTGRYKRGHVVLLNGSGLTGAEGLKVLDGVKAGDRVQIVNIEPYARKIEGQRANRRKQWRGRRGLSRQAPGGVYRRVLVMVQQRFGRSLFVDYRLEQLAIDEVQLRSSAAKLRSNAGFYTYPVLQLYIKPTIH